MQTYLQGYEMTPAQEKKLDRAIALMSTVNRKLDRLPAEIWGRKWDDYSTKEKSTASDALFTIQQLARAIAKKVGA